MGKKFGADPSTSVARIAVFRDVKASLLAILGLALLLTLTASVAKAGQYGDFTFSATSNAVTITKYTGPGGAVTIPSAIPGVGTVTSIGNSAFYRCASLTNITIPDSVTSIGDAAFYRCSNLTNITIPDSVTFMGVSAFKECTSLTSVAIPDSITSVGDSTFYGCARLTSVTIPNSVTSIAGGAFYGCVGLTSITIPNCVTTIGNGAFMTCTNLTSITIPSSVTSIGDGAFEFCISLTSITIPRSVTSIGYSTFYKCASLTSVTIPNSVTSVGNNAFDSCIRLTSVIIPNSVTNIGKEAFASCASLARIEVDSSNATFSSLNGVLFDKERSTLVLYPGGLDGAYAIPSGVASIGDSAFETCRSLTSVTIPSSVTSIGEDAFYYCTSLTSITIPTSVTSIGDWAFGACRRLTSAFFEGNALTNFGSPGFIDAAPDFTIYYPSTASGWSTPIWNGYAAKPYNFLPLEQRPVGSLVVGSGTVAPVFTRLQAGSNYQLQVSSDLTSWSNSGAVFAATNVSQACSQSFDTTDASRLFFRLEAK